MRITALVAVMALALCWTSAGRAESVENPTYLSWAKCKPGTSITLKVTRGERTITSISKLIDVTDEKCTLEITITIGTRSMAGPKQEIPHQLTDPQQIEKLKQDRAAEVDDTVTTDAGTFHCKRFASTAKSGDKVTVWADESVPGEIVKVQIESSDPSRASGTELIAIDRK